MQFDFGPLVHKCNFRFPNIDCRALSPPHKHLIYRATSLSALADCLNCFCSSEVGILAPSLIFSFLQSSFIFNDSYKQITITIWCNSRGCCRYVIKKDCFTNKLHRFLDFCCVQLPFLRVGVEVCITQIFISISIKHALVECCSGIFLRSLLPLTRIRSCSIML